MRAVPASSLTELGATRKVTSGLFCKSPEMTTGSARMVIPVAVPDIFRVSAGSATPSSFTSIGKETRRSVSPAGITTRNGATAV